MSSELNKPIEPYDPEEMLKCQNIEPNFVLDDMHFGRGNFYYDKQLGIKLNHTLTDLKIWKINGGNLEPVSEGIAGILYDDETYFIASTYSTTTRDYRTEQLLNNSTNVVYFYWKGERASQGFSPIPNNWEQDYPVERICQWAEPPIFLRLFNGKMIVRSSRGQESNSNSHLYILRGEIAEEIHLYEVPCKWESLRSRTCFILIDDANKTCMIWYGSKSTTFCKNFVKITAEILIERNPEFILLELNEGEEDNNKFIDCGSNNNYYSLKDSVYNFDFTPRLFYFNQITGNFTATEIKSSHTSPNICAFPFLQSHLYTTVQPALFLLDNKNEIWLWHGWDTIIEEVFSAAKQTAINYALKRNSNIRHIKCVFAGLEPLAFTNLFPIWNKNYAVQFKGEVENLIIEVKS